MNIYITKPCYITLTFAAVHWGSTILMSPEQFKPTTALLFILPVHVKIYKSWCSSLYLRLSLVFSRSHKQVGKSKHICCQKVFTGSKMQNELLSNLSHLGYEFSNIKMSNHVRADRNLIHMTCSWEMDVQTCHLKHLKYFHQR